MTTDTLPKFEIALGDNARSADLPAITYACVEGATIKDIMRFQLPLLNKYKGAACEVHLSAGHCDIVQATLKKHRSSTTDFNNYIGTALHDFTDLILQLRGMNASIVIYPLRDPKEYTPMCAGLRPLAPYYEQGVKTLNDYIFGWAAQLNFATVAHVK